jgi:hypothetical protein
MKGINYIMESSPISLKQFSFEVGTLEPDIEFQQWFIPIDLGFFISE